MSVWGTVLVCVAMSAYETVPVCGAGLTCGRPRPGLRSVQPHMASGSEEIETTHRAGSCSILSKEDSLAGAGNPDNLGFL